MTGESIRKMTKLTSNSTRTKHRHIELNRKAIHDIEVGKSSETAKIVVSKQNQISALNISKRNNTEKLISPKVNRIQTTLDDSLCHLNSYRPQILKNGPVSKKNQQTKLVFNRINSQRNDLGQNQDFWKQKQEMLSKKYLQRCLFDK